MENKENTKKILTTDFRCGFEAIETPYASVTSTDSSNNPTEFDLNDDYFVELEKFIGFVI